MTMLTRLSRMRYLFIFQPQIGRLRENDLSTPDLSLYFHKHKSEF